MFRSIGRLAAVGGVALALAVTGTPALAASAGSPAVGCTRIALPTHAAGPGTTSASVIRVCETVTTTAVRIVVRSASRVTVTDSFFQAEPVPETLTSTVTSTELRRITSTSACHQALPGSRPVGARCVAARSGHRRTVAVSRAKAVACARTGHGFRLDRYGWCKRITRTTAVQPLDPGVRIAPEVLGRLDVGRYCGRFQTAAYHPRYDARHHAWSCVAPRQAPITVDTDWACELQYDRANAFAGVVTVEGARPAPEASRWACLI